MVFVKPGNILARQALLYFTNVVPQTGTAVSSKWWHGNSLIQNFTEWIFCKDRVSYNLKFRKHACENRDTQNCNPEDQG